jgi:hypothetical protein
VTAAPKFWWIPSSPSGSHGPAEDGPG